MGKEGNQAASFSDYAIPNFESLRRLVLWYGSNFGINSMKYVMIIFFKSEFAVFGNMI